MMEFQIVLVERNFWFRFRFIIQFSPMWSIDDKAETELKIALDKYYPRFILATKSHTNEMGLVARVSSGSNFLVQFVTPVYWIARRTHAYVTHWVYI